MGVLKLAVNIMLYVVIAEEITFGAELSPEKVFQPFSPPAPRKLEGKLAPNDILDKAELLIDGEFQGPETVVIRGDQVFAGIEGGFIIQIEENGTWKKIVKLKENCDESWQSRCARPLGLRFNNQGSLIVTDAYYGLFEVDVDSGTATQLLSTDTPLSDGDSVGYLNDVDVHRNGMIYFTDTSKLARFHNIFLEGFGDATGRLLQFDPRTNATEILVNGVHYANGVVISNDGNFLLFVESIRSRVWKYYLDGPKKGTKEIFIDALPGLPDNIRSNGKGGFYICLVFPDTDEHPSIFRLLGPLSPVRNLMLKTQQTMLKMIEVMDTYFPDNSLKAAHASVSHLGSFGDLSSLPRKVIVVEVDENGTILGSLQNKEGKIAYISDIEVGEKYAYFGSPYENKLWRIKKEYLN